MLESKQNGLKTYLSKNFGNGRHGELSVSASISNVLETLSLLLTIGVTSCSGLFNDILYSLIFRTSRIPSSVQSSINFHSTNLRALVRNWSSQRWFLKRISPIRFCSVYVVLLVYMSLKDVSQQMTVQTVCDTVLNLIFAHLNLSTSWFACIIKMDIAYSLQIYVLSNAVAIYTIFGDWDWFDLQKFCLAFSPIENFCMFQWRDSPS